jgi:hypothetical protein
MTDQTPQLDASLAQLNALIRSGRAIGGALAADPASPVAQAGARIWQHDCANTVSQLSGGSKQHWLSRAYSDALLVRSADGGARVEAPVTDIVGRVLGVLDQAVASLSQPSAAVAAPPQTHRFDFVRNEALRPILEEAFLDSGRAFEEGDFERSLMTSCSVLEAIITDALEADARLKPSRSSSIADLSFDERIAAAERANFIRGGCARLPAVARTYRDANDSRRIVTAQDAKVTRQVLHVVMRDLDPGR